MKKKLPKNEVEVFFFNKQYFVIEKKIFTAGKGNTKIKEILTCKL